MTEQSHGATLLLIEGVLPGMVRNMGVGTVLETLAIVVDQMAIESNVHWNEDRDEGFDPSPDAEVLTAIADKLRVLQHKADEAGV